ncbi:coiled-coil domain-containing protein 178 [Microcebus murinus]|uniref:Coiled-coil domain containing 178 n=1 Tax=Microcebus murinus TaxID=30608 RepID=A0A8B7HLT1_MICMU|nr:coiled-coil domain-containing protein 178 isoform X1 [Microcebus murinus]XP_012638033.1 coiled-coil domain-containing protein 178 isoform X1 [Microcebus murinus]
MPENKKISPTPARGDQSKIDGACFKAKALRVAARSRTYGDHAQGLVLFGPPKEAVEIFQESEMTNTEEVNKGIYFGYPCRRRSCAIVKIPAPCVNKMISHIQDVESKIQEHLKKFETSFEEWSRTSSTKDLKEDRGTTTPVEEVKPEERRDETCPELKQEMETLLSEAIHLIKSLETDRAEAEEALQKQRSRKTLLNTKIDSWSIWKLEELPLAVQREHEAYLRDFIELRWHLEDKVNKLKHFEEEKKQLEEANAKIQADVYFMIERGPLLKLKQDQELVALNKIYTQKREVTEIFDQTHDELEETSENCKNTKLKAKQDKEEMDKEIHNYELNLEAYRRELEKLSNLYVHYSSSIHSITVDMEENEEVVTEVMKEAKSSKNEVSALSKTLDDLRKTYDQLTWKKKMFEQEYVEALNDFYATKKTCDIELSNVTKDYGDISVVHTQLSEENKKLLMDLNAVKVKISDSIKKKTEFESEIKYLTRRKAVNEDILKELYKESYHVGAVFHVTKHNTDELETKIADVRRKFKGREEFLKKLIRAEVAAGIMIQKKIYAIQEEQLLEKQELVKQKAIYALALEEAEVPLLKLEEEALRIRTAHREQSDALYKIIEKKNYVRKRVAKTKKKLRKKEKKTLDALTETEDQRTAISQELELVKAKIIICRAKIRELDEELRTKESRKRSFDQSLNILKKQFIYVRFKKEHAQAVFDHYMQEKKSSEERMSQNEQRFRRLLGMRQKTLDEIKKTEEDSLAENLRLAQEYQKLQAICLTEKDNYLNQYDRQLSLDASIRDKKQLSELQKRMRKLWPEYFKLVVLFNEMKLASIQRDSQESVQKILAVQEESSSLMQHILDFFKTLKDGSCENDG